MLSKILSEALNLLLTGLIWPLGLIATVSLILNFILTLFQLQEQTFLFLIKIVVAGITIIIFFPTWNSNFCIFVERCLEQVILIGGV